MLKRNLKKRRCWCPLIIKGNTTTHHNNLGCIVFRDLTCFNCFSIPILIILSFQFIRHTLIQLIKSKTTAPTFMKLHVQFLLKLFCRGIDSTLWYFLPAHLCAPVEFSCILLRSQYSHWYEQCKKKNCAGDFITRGCSCSGEASQEEEWPGEKTGKRRRGKGQKTDTRRDPRPKHVTQRKKSYTCTDRLPESVCLVNCFPRSQRGVVICGEKGPPSTPQEVSVPTWITGLGACSVKDQQSASGALSDFD